MPERKPERLSKILALGGATPIVLSFDPGDVHCGIAGWIRGVDRWECVAAMELDPDHTVNVLWSMLKDRHLEEVAYEGFWLRPGTGALQQAGSEMKTCQLIGAITHLCRLYGTPSYRIANGQDATIKRMTSAGYVWSATGAGGHAKDAEAVGIQHFGFSALEIRRTG